MSTVEAVTNKQNDEIYALSSVDSAVNIWNYFKHNKPVYEMAWAAFASDVSKSRLVCIDYGLKANNQVYLITLQKKVLPWLIETFENK